MAITDVGAACTNNNECEAQMCASVGDTGYCSAACTLGAEGACPDRLACADAGGGTGVCWPDDDGSGCCDASGAGAPTALLGMGVLGLVLGRRRQR